MAEIKKVEKAKLFVGVFYIKRSSISAVLEKLKEKYGDIELESEEFEFSYTDYYKPEMGDNLVKKFFIFKKPIDRSKLAGIKTFTNELEEKFAQNNNRTVNLDPGYYTKTQLVLASAKESPKKIYLGKGIFAHLTYVFANKSWQPTERCFPEFKDTKIIEFFSKIRHIA